MLALTQGGPPSRFGGPEVLPALPNPPASADGAPVCVTRRPSLFRVAGEGHADRVQRGRRRPRLSNGGLCRLGPPGADRPDVQRPAVPSPGQLQYNADALQRHSPGRIRGDRAGEADRGCRLHHRRPPPLEVRPGRTRPPRHRLLCRDRPDRLRLGPLQHPGGNLVTAHRSHAATSTTPPRRAEPTSPGRSPAANGASSATPGCAGSRPSSWPRPVPGRSRGTRSSSGSARPPTCPCG